MKNKGRPRAEWLQSLADGEYTVQNLVELTNKSPIAVRWMMRKYAKSARYVANTKSKGIIVYYLWDKEYYQKQINAAQACKLQIDATRGTKQN